ncbi:helix-turn-helix transcriptional regulator [Owenweeksia hongkongensis]|uniref:helix-turn-helix transcriptional regulator n=1 Tax=Owenweeksia hongkongensis TaxID=253245 RepID=UPI003A911E7F
MSLNTSVKILRLQSVIEKTGLSRSCIYDYIQKGRFPKPISIGFRSVGWVENEIDDWIIQRIRQSRK